MSTIYGAEVMDMQEAADYCGYTRGTFRQMHTKWGIPGEYIGGVFMFYKSDLDKFKAGRIPERYGSGIRWRYPKPWEQAA